MKTLNPQPVLASCSDELNFPFSQEARTSPSNDHIQFEPSPCPTNRVHLIFGISKIRISISSGEGP